MSYSTAMVLRRWYPESPPTWTDILVILLALLFVTISLNDLQTVYWNWLLLGLVIGFIATGPLANSTIGKRVGTWFREIGMAGRAVCIISFAIVIFLSSSYVDVPSELVTSVGSGFMISVSLCVFMYVVYSGKVSRWK